MMKETEVSFQADDGWLIKGIFAVPSSAATEPVPAAILVPSPSHDVDVYGHNGYPSLRAAIETENIATLRIDIRGRGKSSEPQEYHTLTDEQREKVSLDIHGAAEFLRRQKEIAQSGIAVVAEGSSAHAAALAVVEDQGISAFVLLSGRLGQRAKEALAHRTDLPVLCVVSQEDKISFSDMTCVYKTSRASASDILIRRDLGIGNPMFSMWAAKYPNETPLERTVASWIGDRLSGSQSQEISFQTEDGWTIFGSLQLPGRAQSRQSPGVVLVHSNLSDRHIFDELEQSLAQAGFAVLNIDFRGRGKSRNRGSYFALPAEERNKGSLDVIAAIDFLERQDGVNGNEIAIVATSVGVKYGVQAACSDPRVVSLVVLGGLPDHDELKKAEFPILFVSNQGVPQIAEAFRQSYSAARNRRSQLLKYEGGAVGYQLFQIDQRLIPLIVEWLRSQSSQPAAA